MKTVYDVRQLLKRYGTFVYTGDRIGDLDLMEMEIDELFSYKFIQNSEYKLAKLILRKERNRLSRKGEIS